MSWVDNFWSHVGNRDSLQECWIWNGAIFKKKGEPTSSGYGAFGRRVMTSLSFYATGETAAHRVSWVLHFGPIPAGKLVRHTCHNPRCVNPVHLLLGTTLDNMQDRRDRGGYVFKLIPVGPWNVGYFQHD